MASITKVLCPVDFSTYSQHALDRAVALAHVHHARLTVLHVLPPIPSLIPSNDVAMYPAFVYTDADLSQLRQQLDTFVRESAGETLADPVLIEGPVVPEILDQAAARQADVIVIGTHGRSGFERLMLGSVAQRVLAKAPCPVMAVPPRVPDALPARDGRFARVLCAMDFSPAATAALQWLPSLELRQDARVVVAHVVHPAPVMDPVVMGGPGIPDFDGLAASIASEQLHACVAAALGTMAGVTETVTIGRAAPEIVRIATDVEADLIVMGTHAGARGRLGFGSTTNHVIRHAHCPVFAVRG
jgi:nucleotide-binding universal stress UspA family protein